MRKVRINQIIATHSLSVRFFLLALLFNQALLATEIESIETSREDDHYIVRLSVVANIRESFAREILLDPDRVLKVNTSIIEVLHLPSDTAGVIRFRDKTHMCALFFCVDYRNTLRLQTLENGDIRLDVEPEDSDFEYGSVVWQTQAINEEQTRLSFRSENKPSFWVPPLIGMSMMESRMSEVIQDMIRRMECEYTGDTECLEEVVDSTIDSSGF